MKKKASSVLKSLTVLLILSAVINAAFLLSIPTDAKNSLFFGFSASRLFLLLFFLLLLIGLVFLLLRISKEPEPFLHWIHINSQKSSWQTIVFIFFLIFILLGWIALYEPPYMLRDFKDELTRLSPIILWMLTFACSLVILLHMTTHEWRLFGDITKKWRPINNFLIIFCIVFLIYLAIAYGYPHLTDELWVGRFSVPILITQIAAAWVMTTFAIFVSLTYGIKIPIFISKNKDWIIFVIIWFCAAIFWINQPIEFVPDLNFTTIEQHIQPMAPNYEIYPRKDSQTYFNISESIVIGQGVYRSIDKPLFVTFEGLNNWLNNGNYLKMLNWQILFLALFPGIIYLLGKELFDRWAGLLAAAFAILQEINAINLMDEFPVVSSKVMLTEPFIQVWTGLLTLILVLAFKSEDKTRQRNLMLICGGALGLSSLFRLNTLFIVPFIILALIVRFSAKWKTILQHSAVFILGILVALSPWMIHNTIKFNDPAAFIKAKVEGVIINQRYEDMIDQPEMIDGIKDSNETVSPTINPLAGMESETNGATDAHEKEAATDTAKEKGIWSGLDLDRLTGTILRHFLNNTVTSFSILPTSIVPQDLFHGSRSQQFWDNDSENFYEGIQFVVLLANLAVICMGILSLTNKQKFQGFIPFFIYTGYYLSNGVALSSGNRYSQPVAWIILLYYACGLIAISTSFMQFLGIREKANSEHSQVTKNILNPGRDKLFMTLCICGILLFGSTPIIADLVPVDRYVNVTDDLALVEFGSETELVSNLGLGFDVLKSIADSGTSNLKIGRALYPIQLNSQEYEVIYGLPEPESIGTFLTFFFLDAELNNGQRMVFYPENSKIEIPNRSDVLITGNGHEAFMLCVVDEAYASGIEQYETIVDIPMECYQSKRLSEN